MITHGALLQYLVEYDVKVNITIDTMNKQEVSLDKVTERYCKAVNRKRFDTINSMER